MAAHPRAAEAFDATRFRSSRAHDGDGVTLLDGADLTAKPVTKPAGSLQWNGSELVCTTAGRGPVIMGDQRSGLPRVWRARKRPTWYLAATLPDRIPRCTSCGRPALALANRVARVVGNADPEPGQRTTRFEHRDCSTAPKEFPIRVTSDRRLSRVLEFEGAPFVVTHVAFVSATESVPAHWLVLGIPEREGAAPSDGRSDARPSFDRQPDPSC